MVEVCTRCERTKTAKQKEKEPPRMFPARRLYPINSDCSCNLVGTETTRTNINGFRSTVYHGFDSSDIGLPCSVGFSVGVGHIVTEHNTFSANTAFCHDSHTSCTELFRSARRFDGGGMQTYKPSESDTSVIVSQILGEIKSFFYIFQKIRFVGRKIGKFPQKPDVRGRGKEKPTGKIAEKVLRRQ